MSRVIAKLPDRWPHEDDDHDHDIDLDDDQNLADDSKSSKLERYVYYFSPHTSPRTTSHKAVGIHHAIGLPLISSTQPY